MSDRLEIRLDAERRRKFDELAKNHHTSISDLVRALVDREYEAWLTTERTSAARAISDLSIEDVPDPESLSQELGQAYDPPIR
jgi:hypothetical protein